MGLIIKIGNVKKMNQWIFLIGSFWCYLRLTMKMMKQTDLKLNHQWLGRKSGGLIINDSQQIKSKKDKICYLSEVVIFGKKKNQIKIKVMMDNITVIFLNNL